MISDDVWVSLAHLKCRVLQAKRRTFQETNQTYN